MEELILKIIENVPDEMISYIYNTLGEKWVKDPEKLLFAILVLLGIISIHKTKKGKYYARTRVSYQVYRYFTKSYKYALHLYYRKLFYSKFYRKIPTKYLNKLISEAVKLKMKEIFGENVKGSISESEFLRALLFLAFLIDRKIL